MSQSALLFDDPRPGRVLPWETVSRMLHRAGYLDHRVTEDELIVHRSRDGAVPRWGRYDITNEVVDERSYVFVAWRSEEAAFNLAGFLNRLAVEAEQVSATTVRIHVRYFPGWHCDHAGRERRPRRRPRPS